MESDPGHDLRNGLSIIQASLEAMLDGMVPVDEHHLRTLLTVVHSMNRLVDKLPRPADDR